MISFLKSMFAVRPEVLPKEEDSETRRFIRTIYPLRVGGALQHLSPHSMIPLQIEKKYDRYLECCRESDDMVDIRPVIHAINWQFYSTLVRAWKADSKPELWREGVVRDIEMILDDVWKESCRLMNTCNLSSMEVVTELIEVIKVLETKALESTIVFRQRVSPLRRILSKSQELCEESSGHLGSEEGRFAILKSVVENILDRSCFSDLHLLSTLSHTGPKDFECGLGPINIADVLSAFEEAVDSKSALSEVHVKLSDQQKFIFLGLDQVAIDVASAVPLLREVEKNLNNYEQLLGQYFGEGTCFGPQFHSKSNETWHSPAQKN